MSAYKHNPRGGWPVNEFGFREIPGADLMLLDVPATETDWIAVAEFALSFDGYKFWEPSGRCAEIANDSLASWRVTRTLPDTLEALRTCLFFEQRRWRHFQQHPDDEAMAYIRAILVAIRAKLIAMRVN